eukprot:GAHX01001740.1.p1 GENE.GAHX01001740.1~~GAHX01001740.1.p1  ORF type:complete len:164 (-),score=17.23 GAHX01001740.1:44-535(-)
MLNFSSLVKSFNNKADEGSFSSQDCLSLNQTDCKTNGVSQEDNREAPTILIKSGSDMTYMKRSKKAAANKGFVFETKTLSEDDFCNLIKSLNREEILKTIEVNNISEPLFSSFCLEDLREIVIDLWRAKLLVKEDPSSASADAQMTKFLSRLGPLNIYFKYIL